MSSSVFFDGGVSDAIRLSNAEKRPLVVFLKGTDSNSQEMEEAFLSENFKALVENCLVLLLEDDLEDSENEKYLNGRNFRQFFPVTELPAVFMLAINGSALVSMCGKISVDELLEKLRNGLSVYNNSLNAGQSSASNGAEAPSTSSPQRAVQSNNTQVPTAKEEKKDTAVAPEQSIGIPPKVERVVIKRKKKAPEKKPDPPVYTTALLRIRLTNDDYIENEFAADATLREVCSFVDVHRTDGGAPYVLEMMYPRRELGEDKYTATLKELDLVPRSTVRLMPVASGSGATFSMADAEGGMFASVSGAIGSVIGYLSSFFSTPENIPADSRAPPLDDMPEQSPPAEPIPRQQESSTIRRRGTWGGNVYSLHDRDNRHQGPSDNSFWNGNSTEYGGDENKHED